MILVYWPADGRLYHCHIYLNPDNVTTVIKATVVLHNILTLPNDKVHTDVVDNRAEIHDDALKILQSKEIDLQQMPMMSETNLLTTSTVTVVLMNGKMIVHKIEFIEVIYDVHWRLPMLPVQIFSLFIVSGSFSPILSCIVF